LFWFRKAARRAGTLMFVKYVFYKYKKGEGKKEEKKI